MNQIKQHPENVWLNRAGSHQMRQPETSLKAQ